MPREHLRLLLNWLSWGRLGHRRSWVVVAALGTPWQDNLTDRGLRWRERAAHLHGQRVFGVDYLICRRCRLGWVEDPATADGLERCGLAAAGLTQLRAEHPGLVWHTMGGHMPGSEPFWEAVGSGIQGKYQRHELCEHRS